MRFFVPRLLPCGQYGYGLRLLPCGQYGYAATLLPLAGQYAPRFGYLPAANTPHKSIHCVHIPKSINTSQFPTQMFAFSDLFSQNR